MPPYATILNQAIYMHTKGLYSIKVPITSTKFRTVYNMYGAHCHELILISHLHFVLTQLSAAKTSV